MAIYVAQMGSVHKVKPARNVISKVLILHSQTVEPSPPVQNFKGAESGKKLIFFTGGAPLEFQRGTPCKKIDDYSFRIDFMIMGAPSKDFEGTPPVKIFKGAGGRKKSIRHRKHNKNNQRPRIACFNDMYDLSNFYEVYEVFLWIEKAKSLTFDGSIESC